ncbi:MAG: ABC transporter substrate-binding protein, partial [Pseudonocardiaceae bacterium]
MTEQLFVPPTTAKSRIRRKRKWIGLAIAVLILAAALGWGGYQVLHTCGWLGSGVYEVDGECVGVTDGSYLFDPAFEQVQKKIADENAWVRRQPSYVTVALLNPLTATPTSVLSTEEILEQLEGAYTAQYQANHTSAVGDSGPPIQLVLANEGSTEDQWQPVVEQLVDMAGQQDNPLVAVVGLGLSIAQTKQGAQELSRHDIPMVGAIIAADDFDHNHIPGLITVSPTSQDYARSLRGHLDSRDDLRSAILVSDSNSDSNSDLFTRTLRDAFRENMADLIKFPDQIFTGGG